MSDCSVCSVQTGLESLKWPTVHLLWKGDIPGAGFCKMAVVNVIRLSSHLWTLPFCGYSLYCVAMLLLTAESGFKVESWVNDILTTNLVTPHPPHLYHQPIVGSDSLAWSYLYQVWKWLEDYTTLSGVKQLTIRSWLPWWGWVWTHHAHLGLACLCKGDSMTSDWAYHSMGTLIVLSLVWLFLKAINVVFDRYVIQILNIIFCFQETSLISLHLMDDLHMQMWTFDLALD